MATPREVMERRKAQILEAAQRATAEVERDMATLEAITSKYGLEVVDKASAAPTKPAKPSILENALNFAATAVEAVAMVSITRQSQEMAEAIIRQRGHPVPLGEIFDELKQHGVVFGSKDPKNTLSAVLGQSAALVSIRGTGWWLANEPWPPNDKVADSESEGDQSATLFNQTAKGREAVPGGGT
jgi:hypothetical protein